MKLALAVFAFAVFASAQTPSTGQRRPLVQIDVPEQVQAHAGKDVEIPVKFWIADGYHINSNKPTEEYMLPTKMEWQPSTLKHTSDVFPPADQRVFGFTAGKKLSVFEGARVLKAHFTAPTAAGTVMLEGTFRYQACDNAACYPPGKVVIKVPVKIVP